MLWHRPKRATPAHGHGDAAGVPSAPASPFLLLLILCGILLLYLLGSSSGLLAPASQPLRKESLEACVCAAAPPCPLAAAALPCPSAPSCAPAPQAAAAPPPPPPPQQPQPQPAAAAAAAQCEPASEALARNVAYFMPVVNGGGLGHHDAGTLLPYLMRFWGGSSGKPALLVDIGANLGDTSALMVKMFTDADCVRYQARKPPTGMHEDCSPGLPVRILAYEPVPENFALLTERAEHDQWPAVGWRGFQAALTSPAAVAALPKQQDGSVALRFYGALVGGKMVGGDQQGGLGPSNGLSDTSFITVPGWTLDGHLASIGEGSSEILLLKVDTEGFDHQSMLGAAGTLGAQRAVFLVFEYNDKWHAAQDSLKPVAAWLAGLGYECYWITADRLVPLSGRLWDDRYEFFAWSNVFCHRASDAKAATLVTFFNGEARRPVC